MSSSRYRRLSYAVLLIAVACGDGDQLRQDLEDPSEVAEPGEGAIVQEEPEPELPDEIGLPCDVKAFLAKNCQGCHGAEAKNGTPLLTRDNLLTASKKDPMRKVAERMALRMSDKEKPMPPMGKGEPVASADLEMFLAWLDSSMPAGRCDQ